MGLSGIAWTLHRRRWRGANRHLAGMAPSSCEQVAAPALLASADSRKGISATRSSCRLPRKDASADKDRVRRYRHDRRFVLVLIALRRRRSVALSIFLNCSGREALTCTHARNRRLRPSSLRSGTPPSIPICTRSPSRNDDRSTVAVRCSALAGTARRGGNGLAFGAAAGTLHPAADRPLSRPGGQSRGARRRASRARRGPSDRPGGPPLTRHRRRGP